MQESAFAFVRDTTGCEQSSGFAGPKRATLEKEIDARALETHARKKRMKEMRSFNRRAGINGRKKKKWRWRGRLSLARNGVSDACCRLQYVLMRIARICSEEVKKEIDAWPGSQVGMSFPFMLSLFQKGQVRTGQYRFLARGGGFAYVVTEASFVPGQPDDSTVILHNAIAVLVPVINDVGSPATDARCGDCFYDSVRLHLMDFSSPTAPMNSSNIFGGVLKNASMPLIHPPFTLAFHAVYEFESSSRSCFITPWEYLIDVNEEHIEQSGIQDELAILSNQQLEDCTLKAIKPDLGEVSESDGAPASPEATEESDPLQEEGIKDPVGEEKKKRKAEVPHYGISWVTAAVVIPRWSPDIMNKGFLVFKDNTMFKEDTEELGHFTPEKGTLCLPLETPAFVLDEEDDVLGGDIFKGDCLQDDEWRTFSKKTRDSSSSPSSITASPSSPENDGCKSPGGISCSDSGTSSTSFGSGPDPFEKLGLDAFSDSLSPSPKSESHDCNGGGNGDTDTLGLEDEPVAVVSPPQKLILVRSTGRVMPTRFDVLKAMPEGSALLAALKRTASGQRKPVPTLVVPTLKTYMTTGTQTSPPGSPCPADRVPALSPDSSTTDLGGKVEGTCQPTTKKPKLTKQESPLSESVLRNLLVSGQDNAPKTPGKVTKSGVIPLASLLQPEASEDAIPPLLTLTPYDCDVNAPIQENSGLLQGQELLHALETAVDMV
ncbi:unnamed protein product [Darwinula stevensoni]|uniref:HIF-1 alpha C-terminal transactivation domain-containing protein n=1 Tax=Darwinula stevensoni TaxID=69355 RepID=A0A7R8X7L7_9CRUS|nr:unnamed protein product [Darwinula stevensoni]CAG0880655.1 unnamed protein product [Darwinula stevensoni]